MKCKVFTGPPELAVILFNMWAKGKALCKDVLIHTQVAERIVGCDSTAPILIIIVYHPDDPYWDKTQVTTPQPTPPEQTKDPLQEVMQI